MLSMQAPKYICTCQARFIVPASIHRVSILMQDYFNLPVDCQILINLVVLRFPEPYYYDCFTVCLIFLWTTFDSVLINLIS